VLEFPPPLPKSDVGGGIGQANAIPVHELLPAPGILILLSTVWEHSRPVLSCEAEIEATRGISADDGSFLPFYKDLGLIAYLTRLASDTAEPRLSSGLLAVLPVFTADRLCFMRGGRVYISTAWVVESQAEEELQFTLTASLRGKDWERTRKRVVPQSPCAMLPPPGLGFDEMRAAVRRDIARYQEATERRLRPRAARVLKPAESQPRQASAP